MYPTPPKSNRIAYESSSALQSVKEHHETT
jgi:hypothetical protein